MSERSKRRSNSRDRERDRDRDRERGSKRKNREERRSRSREREREQRTERSRSDEERRPRNEERKERRVRDREERNERSRSREEDRESEINPHNSQQQQKQSQKQSQQQPQKQQNRNVWGNVAEEEEYEILKKKERGEDISEEDKEKPNFGLTGSLAKDQVTGNIHNGVLLKWTEPLDAGPPQKGWRIYVFKEDQIIDTLYLHRQSVCLLGRDSLVADYILNHPSCSSQHAVIQFRFIPDKSNQTITTTTKKKRIVKPFLMDLKSTNFTFLNGEQIEDSRYYELKPQDIIKFGNSTREYVVIYDNSEENLKKKP